MDFNNLTLSDGSVVKAFRFSKKMKAKGAFLARADISSAARFSHSEPGCGNQPRRGDTGQVAAKRAIRHNELGFRFKEACLNTTFCAIRGDAEKRQNLIVAILHPVPPRCGGTRILCRARAPQSCIGLNGLIF